nr:excalibur calcium-binding domain-containing protein [Mycobacterium nebraskense]
MRTARSRSSSGYLLARPIIRILPRSGVSGNAGTAHTDAKAHGRCNIPRGDQAYCPSQDRDGDGLACEC